MPPGRRSSRAPRKRFGQHFLEPAWVAKVVEAIDPRPSDDFVEIGPGRGALTRPLGARVHRLTAFEIDRDLAAALRESAPGVQIVEGDFLRSASVLAGTRTPIRVAGNLPYNVATPILFSLLDLYRAGVPLVDATLMLQREVADRILAPPGGAEYGVLSVLLQQATHVDLLLALPPGAFRPPPKVRSALVRVRFRDPHPTADRPALFSTLVRSVFTRRRKTVANALRAFRDGRLSPGTALERAGIDPGRRPQTLTVEELVRLSNVYAAVADAP
jgi:16S rRNA (adenine1518-N6/adenine1519-N6)-dimethyltransferase